MAMTLRLTESDTARLRQQAKANGLSMQQATLSALRAWLDAQERGQTIQAALADTMARYPEALRRLGQ